MPSLRSKHYFWTYHEVEVPLSTLNEPLGLITCYEAPETNEEVTHVQVTTSSQPSSPTPTGHPRHGPHQPSGGDIVRKDKERVGTGDNQNAVRLPETVKDVVLRFDGLMTRTGLLVIKTRPGPETPHDRGVAFFDKFVMHFETSILTWWIALTIPRISYGLTAIQEPNPE